MQGVGMHNAARVLEMEMNALIVSAAMNRVLAGRLPPGKVRRFLFEQAALSEESASNPVAVDGAPSVEPGRSRPAP